MPDARPPACNSKGKQTMPSDTTKKSTPVLHIALVLQLEDSFYTHILAYESHIRPCPVLSSWVGVGT